MAWKNNGEKENDKKRKNAAKKTETETDVWRWIAACGGCIYRDPASAQFQRMRTIKSIGR